MPDSAWILIVISAFLVGVLFGWWIDDRVLVAIASAKSHMTTNPADGGGA